MTAAATACSKTGTWAPTGSSPSARARPTCARPASPPSSRTSASGIDRQGANPGEDLRDMLESYRCRGRRLGVEYHAYGLTAQRGQMVDAALQGLDRIEDASDLVRLLRLVKSPAELRY